jgi:hypothetical protein
MLQRIPEHERGLCTIALKVRELRKQRKAAA